MAKFKCLCEKGPDTGYDDLIKYFYGSQIQLQCARNFRFTETLTMFYPAPAPDPSLFLKIC
jgi:hypothetical protein